MMSALFKCVHSSLGRRRQLRRISLDPLGDVEIEELFAPDHPGECLALHQLRIGIADVALNVGVEIVGVGPAIVEQGLETGKRQRQAPLAQAQPQRDAAPRRHIQPV